MTNTPKIKVIKQLSGNYVLRISRFQDFGPSDELVIHKTLRKVQADLDSRFGPHHTFSPTRWAEDTKEMIVDLLISPAARLASQVSLDYDHEKAQRESWIPSFDYYRY